MNIKSMLIVTTLLASSAVSATAFSQQSDVQQILTQLVKQAVNTASDEIETQIDKVIITSGNVLSLDGQPPKGKVVITDIAKADVSGKKAQNTESVDE